ncbi:MAG: amidase family protein [Desulfobacterales bacterium]
MTLHELTIHAAQDLLKNKKISSVELTRAVLDRIHAVEPSVDAYISITEDLAMDRAAAADQAIRENNVRPLTTTASRWPSRSDRDKGGKNHLRLKILENFIPPYDATVMVKLNAAGSVMTGKVNMDEKICHGVVHGKLRHQNYEKSPGTGPGCRASFSEAAGLPICRGPLICLGSLGSDTGGSIRQPAAHCGVVGVKPTYGRVSRFRAGGLCLLTGQIGPLAKDVTDAAILLQVIAGYDPKDSTSIDTPSRIFVP